MVPVANAGADVIDAFAAVFEAWAGVTTGATAGPVFAGPILAIALVTGVAADADAAAEASGVMVIDFLDTVAPVAVPVPLINMVCVPGLPESTIVRVALKTPTRVGVKNTSIWQLAPGASDAGNAPQVFVCAKFAAFRPPIVMR